MIDIAVTTLASLTKEAAPYLQFAYDKILKQIMLNDQIRSWNLSYFNALDVNWRSLSTLNTIYSTSKIVKNDCVGVITVTNFQFQEIMNSKFFIPSEYKFVSVDQLELNHAQIKNPPQGRGS